MNSNSIQINLTAGDIRQILTRHFAMEQQPLPDLTNFTCEYRKLSDTPVGFLGDHNILVITLLASEVPLTFFVKILPEGSAAQTDYIEGFGAFKKEVQLYDNLLPRLQECKIGAWGPRCLLVKGEKLIVLEDLAKSQFKGAYFTDGTFDYHHMVVALKCLARFHASSLLWEHQNKQTLLNLFGEELEENAYPTKEGVRAMGFRNACSSLADLIRRIPKYKNSDKLSSILEYFPKVMWKIHEFAKTSSQYRNVVLHADLWANNVMFKYEKSAGTSETLLPVDVRLVDYQLARYAPPALDVVTIITIPSNSGFREKHFSQLIRTYYTTLRQELAAHNIDVTEEIGESEFIESCEHYRLAGLIESALFSHLTLIPPAISKEIVSNSENFENFIKNSRNSVCIRAYDECENYRHRMSDLLTELVDVYVLPLCH